MKKKQKEVRGLKANKPAVEHDFDGHDTIRRWFQGGVLAVRGCAGIEVNGELAECAVYLPADGAVTLHFIDPQWPVEIHEGLDFTDLELKKDDFVSMADYAGIDSDGTKTKLIKRLIEHYGVIE